MEPIQHLSAEEIDYLAQGIDITAEKARTAGLHINECQECQDRYRKALTNDPTLETTLFGDVDAEPPGDDCLDDDMTFRYLNGLTDEIETTIIEMHLSFCIPCELHIAHLREFHASMEEEESLEISEQKRGETEQRITVTTVVPPADQPISLEKEPATIPTPPPSSLKQRLRESLAAFRALFARPQLAWGFAGVCLVVAIVALFVPRPAINSDAGQLAQLKKQADTAVEEARIARIDQQKAKDAQQKAEAQTREADANLKEQLAANNVQQQALQQQLAEARTKLKANSLSVQAEQKRYLDILVASIDRPTRTGGLLGAGTEENAIDIVSPVNTAIETDRPKFVWKVDSNRWPTTLDRTRPIRFELTLNDGVNEKTLKPDIPPASIGSHEPIEWTPTDKDLPVEWQRRGISYSWSVTAYQGEVAPLNKISNGTSPVAFYTLPDENLLKQIQRQRQDARGDSLLLAIHLLKAGFYPEAKTLLQKCVNDKRLTETDHECARRLLDSLNNLTLLNKKKTVR